MYFLFSLFASPFFTLVFSPITLYFLISVVVYLITPIDDKRLELAGETVVDSLRTWGLTLKQSATLTDTKIYQNGVFLFGRKQRVVMIPLANIDSLQVSSGRNYVWLALALSGYLTLIYQSVLRSNSYYSYNSNAVETTIALILSTIFLGLFFISGSRRIVVRSKTDKIVVDSAILSLASFNPEISNQSVYRFANNIQSLIMRSHAQQRNAVVQTGAANFTLENAANVASTRQCSSCYSTNPIGSRFCETCGATVTAS